MSLEVTPKGGLNLCRLLCWMPPSLRNSRKNLALFAMWISPSLPPWESRAARRVIAQLSTTPLEQRRASGVSLSFPIEPSAKIELVFLRC